MVKTSLIKTPLQTKHSATSANCKESKVRLVRALGPLRCHFKGPWTDRSVFLSPLEGGNLRSRSLQVGGRLGGGLLSASHCLARSSLMKECSTLCAPHPPGTDSSLQTLPVHKGSATDHPKAPALLLWGQSVKSEFWGDNFVSQKRSLTGPEQRAAVSHPERRDSNLSICGGQGGGALEVRFVQHEDFGA